MEVELEVTKSTEGFSFAACLLTMKSVSKKMRVLNNNRCCLLRIEGLIMTKGL